MSLVGGYYDARYALAARANLSIVSEAQTPSDISYETPSEASRAPSEIDASIPRLVNEDVPELPWGMPDVSALSIAPHFIPAAPSGEPVLHPLPKGLTKGLDRVDFPRDEEDDIESDQTPVPETYGAGVLPWKLRHLLTRTIAKKRLRSTKVS